MGQLQDLQEQLNETKDQQSNLQRQLQDANSRVQELQHQLQQRSSFTPTRNGFQQSPSATQSAPRRGFNDNNMRRSQQIAPDQFQPFIEHPPS